MKSEGQKVCMAPPRRAPPCHRFNAIVLRSGWTSRGFSLTSKKEAVTYGSSFYAANPKRKRRTPRPSRSRPPKVITRLMMALWKNADVFEVCMIPLRQAGFDRNPAKLIKDGGQKAACGMHLRRTSQASSRSLANHIGSTPNDNIGRICHGIVDSR